MKGHKIIKRQVHAHTGLLAEYMGNKMKKLIKGIMFCLLITVFAGLHCSAYETSCENEIAGYAGMQDISTEVLTKEELSGDSEINLFGKILGFISNAFKTGAVSALQGFALIMTVVVLSSVFSAFKWTTANPSLHTAYEYISILALSGITFSIFTSVFEFVQKALESLNTFMAALLPVVSSLYIFGGNPAASAASNSAMLLFFSLMSTINTKFLMLFLQIAFALCLASAIPGTVNLTSVSTLVKNTTTTVMAFIFTLFGFVMYLQTTIAATADNYTYRTARFASGVFIPVIGSIIGDATRTVFGSIGVIKSTAGAVGITVILSIVIPPIMLVIFYKLALLGSAIISRVLGCEKESHFLYELNGIMNVLMALVIGSAAVLVIAIAVFIKTGVSV
jgi:stage III sporulation protein AE